MNVIVTGGTGLIGTALVERLLLLGHQVTILTRRAPEANLPSGLEHVQWDGRTSRGWETAADRADAIINLAGENLNNGWWTPARKELYRRSRLDAGGAIVAGLSRAVPRARVVIQASGVGFYGTSRRQPVDETAPRGSDFPSRLAEDWERATQPVEALGARRIILRLGVVLTDQGGALPLMALPFRLYIGGPLGSGEQYISWIHLDDVIEGILFLLVSNSASGIYNLTSPDPVTNAEFGRTLGQILKRPYWLKAPAWALKTALGEKSIVVVKGQSALPSRLIEAGFMFKFPSLKSALENIYCQPEREYLLDS